MVKNISRRSESPIHGFQRSRSLTFNAITNRRRAISEGTCRKTRSVKDIEPSLNNTDNSEIFSDAQEPSSDVYSDIDPLGYDGIDHAPQLQGLNLIIRDLEELVSDTDTLASSDINQINDIVQRPLAHSTDDELTDELNEIDVEVEAVPVIVNNPTIVIESPSNSIDESVFDNTEQLIEANNSSIGDLPNQTTVSVLPAVLELTELPEPLQTCALDLSIEKMEPNLIAAIESYVKLKDLWEDDYDGIDTDKVPKDDLKRLVATAVGSKEELATAYLSIRNTPVGQLGEIQDIQNLVDLKKKFIAFRNSAWAVLTAAQNAPQMVVHPSNEQLSRTVMSNMSEATEGVITRRVTDKTPAILIAAESMVERLHELVDKHPETNQQLLTLESQMLTAKLEANDLIDNLKELGSQATSVGMREPAKQLTDAVDAVGEARGQAVTSVRGAREELGLPEGHDIRNLIGTMTAPTFKGDFKDEIDFFTFEKQFTRYLESVGIYTHMEKLAKLQSCMKGPAKDAVINAKSYDAAIITLRDLYAKPELLLTYKTQELVDLGNAPEAVAARRDWYIRVMNKYDYLFELAEEHQIEDFVNCSTLPWQITQMMPRWDKSEFQKRCVKARKRTPGLVVSKRMQVQQLREFMEDMILELGATIDHVIATGYGTSTDMMKTLQIGQKGAHSKQSTNNNQQQLSKPKGTYQVATSSTPDTSQNEPEFPDLSASSISGNEGKKDKSLREQKKGRQATLSAEDAAAEAVGAKPRPRMMVHKAKEPKVMSCTLCKGEHDLAVYCPAFQKARVPDRWILILKTGTCYRCMRSDAGFELKNRWDWFKEHQPFCNDKHVCRHGGCANLEPAQQNHVMICRRHIMQNKSDHTEFKQSLDRDRLKENVKFFQAAPQVHSVGELEEFGSKINAATAMDGAPLYMLHYVPAKTDNALLCFYDTGCMEAAISDRAANLLDTICTKPGPTVLDVAGGKAITIPHGYEMFSLELEQGGSMCVNALRMPEITAEFPIWEIGQAWADIQKVYTKSGNALSKLPTVPDKVGGQPVDLMIGIQYLAQYPELVFQLPSGLAIFRAKIKSVGGHQGVLGGPHKAWKTATDTIHHMGPRSYFKSEMQAIISQSIALNTTMKLEVPTASEDEAPSTGYQPMRVQCIMCDKIDDDVWVDVHETVENPVTEGCYQAIARSSIARDLKLFEDVEKLGSEISYRCLACRNCNNCRRGEELELVSLQEESEQALIEESVWLDHKNKTVYAKLPFVNGGAEKLNNNRRIAEKILETQIRLSEKTPGLKDQVLKAHAKLSDRGHVVKLTDLPEDIQKDVERAPYFIPWRFVFNDHSLSTPTRLVYDASSKSPGGESLNEVLVKGQNKLARLLHLLVQFRYGSEAFSADIKMAYNQLKLSPEYYKYQKYLWKEGLDAQAVTIVMVIVTVIYGVKPAGNLTMAGFAKIVDAAKKIGGDTALGGDILEKKSYMDDILSSHFSGVERDIAAKGLIDALSLGSMSVKAITRSGQPPSEEVSADGKSVGVIGYAWETQSDELRLEIKPVTFTKARRGKSAPPVEGDVKEALKPKFTKRVLAGRVAGVYDPLGLVTPITAQLKLDMSVVCKHAAGWDEMLPSELLDEWVKNIAQIQLLKEIKVPRNIGSRDAASKDLEIIVCSDASQAIAAACVYGRVKLKDGSFDCNLLMAKSKVVTKCTIPRAELRAATLASSLALVTRQNLGKYIVKETYVTDSSITLFWLNQDQRPLMVGVRNSVIDIRRNTDTSNWYHVAGPLNPADIATRQVQVKDIVGDSDWFKGKAWMRGTQENMPLKTAQELVLSADEKEQATVEFRQSEAKGMVLVACIPRITQRYDHSKYMLDPCLKSWNKFIRILAATIKVWNIWKHKAAVTNGRSFRYKQACLKVIGKKPVAVIDQDEILMAEKYVFVRTTKEVKHFYKENMYKEIGQDKDGVLLYTGRILEGDVPERIVGASLDLNPMKFCKPVVCRYSPVAYSIMIYAHEKLTHHSGHGVTLRASREIAFIIHGESLAMEIRKSCLMCRRYRVKLIEATMGNFHPARYSVAPAFYFVQMDIFGPYSARCEHRPHRADVKVWGLAFKCASTLSVATEVLPGYDARSVVDAYARFAYRYGHPGLVFIDQGSNLMSACEAMKISHVDITKGINGKHGTGLKYEVCVVGDHRAQGMVERSIREIKKIFDAVFAGFQMTILSYQTAFYFIANELNNVPLCLGSKYANLDNLDLITPNRLLLGRNNHRAPVGICEADVPTSLMETNEHVAKAWWTLWQEEWMNKLIPQANKLETDPDIKEGDIVTFMKGGAKAVVGETPWQTGRIHELKTSKDGVTRKVVVQYRNSNEKVYRYTLRSVRSLAVVWREEELDIVGRLGIASRKSNVHFMMYNMW